MSLKKLNILAKKVDLALWRVLVLIREASLRSADKHTPQKEKQAR
jgi:hypothetical protein